MTIADIDLNAIREPVDWDAPGNCWTTVLAAFGVTSDSDWHCFAAMRAALQAAGYAIEDLEVSVWHDRTSSRRSGFRRQSLGRFIAGHPEGDYIIATSGHVMALRDGRLTDTDEPGTGRRRVQIAARVTRS